MEKLTVKYCKDCERGFDPYEVEIDGEILIEDEFCCEECRMNWFSDSEYSPV